MGLPWCGSALDWASSDCSAPAPPTFQDDPGWFHGVKRRMKDREVSAAQPRKPGIGQWLPVIAVAGWLPRSLAVNVGRWAGGQLCLALQAPWDCRAPAPHGTASECSAWKVRGLWVHSGGEVLVRKNDPLASESNLQCSPSTIKIKVWGSLQVWKWKKSLFFFVVVANRKKDLLLGRWNFLLDRKDISLFGCVLYAFSYWQK